MIKFRITRTVPNPNYEQELKDFQEGSRRNNGFNSMSPDVNYGPRKEIDAAILDVELTEEQYAAIKRATLEKF